MSDNRRPRRPASGHPRALMIRVRETLARLAPEEHKSRRYVKDAELRQELIEFRADASSNWDGIAERANVEGKLGVLLDLVQRDYEDDPLLAQLAAEVHGSPKAPPQKPAAPSNPPRPLGSPGVFDMVERNHLKAHFRDVEPDRLRSYDHLLQIVCAPTRFGPSPPFLESLATFIISSTHLYPIRIEGLPGTGKTTLLSLLYGCLKQRHLADSSNPVPIYINLRHYDDLIYSEDAPLQSQLKARLTADLQPVADLAERSPGVATVYLIDGVDEYIRFRQVLEEDLLSRIRSSPGGKKIVGVGLGPTGNSDDLKRRLPHLDESQDVITLHSVPLKGPAATHFVDAYLRVRNNQTAGAREQLFECLERFRLAQVDLLTLSLVESRLAQPGYRDFPNISAFLRKYCEDFLLRKSKGGQHTTIAAASALAHGFSILREQVPRKTLLETPGWALMHRHETLCNFLVANHVVERILELAPPRKTPATTRSKRRASRGLNAADPFARAERDLGFVYPEQINKFCKDIVNDSLTNQRAVIAATKRYVTQQQGRRNHSNTARRLLPHLLYLAGRLRDEPMKQQAWDLLRRAKHALVPSLQSSAAKEDLLLARTVYISLAALGDRDAAEEYIRSLIEDEGADELNRGFHLEYYGDSTYSPAEQMTHTDSMLPCPNTFASLVERLGRDDPKKHLEGMREIEVYTLLSLAQHRHAAGKLAEIDRTRLRELLAGTVQPARLSFPALKDYAEMIARNLELPSFPATRIAEFLYRVKTRKRKGWLKRGLVDVESVADHMYGAFLLGLLFLEEKPRAEEPAYDKRRILDMLLVHDLAEAETGDLLPEERDGASLERERDVFEYIGMLSTYGDVANLKRVRDLWDDFEREATPDGEIAKELDKLENLMQLHVYARLPGSVPGFKEWKQSLLDGVKTAAGRRIANILVDGFDHEAGLPAFLPVLRAPEWLGEDSGSRTPRTAIPIFFDLEDLLFQVVTRANETLAGQGASIFLWDDDAGRFVLRESTVMTRFIGKYALKRKASVGDERVGITTYAAETGEPLVIPDVQQEPKWTFYREANLPSSPGMDEHCELSASELRSMAVVPFESGVLRVVGSRSAPRDPFGEGDLQRLMALVDSVSRDIRGSLSFSRLIEMGCVLDVTTVCQQAVEILTKMVAGKACSIFMLDEGSAPLARRVYQCIATTGLAGAADKDISSRSYEIPPDEETWVTAFTAARKCNVVVEDMGSCDFNKEFRLRRRPGPGKISEKGPSGRDEHTGPFMATPLLFRERFAAHTPAMGVMRVTRLHGERAFSPAERRRFFSFAEKLSKTIRQVRYVTLLNELLVASRSNRHFEMVVNEVPRLIGGRGCSVFVGDRHLEMKATSGVLKDRFDRGEIAAYDVTDEASRGYTGAVVFFSRTVRWNSQKEREALAQAPDAIGSSGRHECEIGDLPARFLAVPILDRRRAVGVIRIPKTEDESPFSPDDERMLESIASHLGRLIAGPWAQPS